MSPGTIEGTAPFAAGELDHVGMAVPDLAAASAFYRDALGLTVSAPTVLDGQGIAIVFVQLANIRIELIAPTVTVSPLGDVLGERTINHFLAAHPAGGIHHLCYVVHDLSRSIDGLRDAGIRPLGCGKPIIGAHGTPILFFAPPVAGDTIIELRQRAA